MVDIGALAETGLDGRELWEGADDVGVAGAVGAVDRLVPPSLTRVGVLLLLLLLDCANFRSRFWEDLGGGGGRFALLFFRATVLSCELAWVDPWLLASASSFPPLYSLCFDPLDLELLCDA